MQEPSLILVGGDARDPFADDERVDVVCAFAKAAHGTHPSSACHSV